MDLSGSRAIAAPPDVVWGAILSADCLKKCVPGCTAMTGSAHDGFEATVVQRVGPVKATFKGVVKIADIVSGESLTLIGEGKGGAAGFAAGKAFVQLEPTGLDTTLYYRVEAKIGGKLAQLGSRIVDGFAKKMADQFFQNLQTQIEGRSDGGDHGQSAKKGWLRRVTG